MEKKVLSIGIAAYNMEHYLRRCLDSLLIPHLDKIEVVIANNASTDSTPIIAREYADHYPDSFKVIDIQVNGHYGRAVNTALANSTGKYFKLLDADDSYCADGLEDLVRFLEQSDTDLCVTGYYTTDENNEVSGRVCVPEGLVGRELNADSIRWGADTPSLLLSMHSLCVKRSILIYNQFALQEGIGYVDTEYNYYCLLYSRRIAFLNTMVYRYLVGRQGQTISPETSSKNSLSFWKVSKRIMSDFNVVKDRLSPVTRDNVTIPIYKVSSCFFFAELFIKKAKDIHRKEVAELIHLCDECGIDLKNYKFHNIDYVAVYKKTGVSFHWLYFLTSKLKTFFKCIVAHSR